MTTYTYHVGEKFHADGSVRQYPGSTIICFADPESALYQAGVSVQNALSAQPFGHKFALLPPSSFHMTVFSLILDAQRVLPLWSAFLPVDTPLAQMDQFFIERVATVAPPDNFRMCMTYIGGKGLSFRLSPADEDTYHALHGYRRRISEATGVHYPDHDTYEFHMTLAYNLIVLTDDEKRAFAEWKLNLGEALRCDVGVFDTGAPHLTFFDDMFAFLTIDQGDLLRSRG
ncbi:MAG: hypothetical protein CUN53_06865 [Phototrophicales bacterium]|nr:MAG: hypothetical protein CUN53_06865 [Phototrophicales bacterium]